MKRLLTILLGVLLIAAVTAPALAWEFSMTGESEFRYRYFARQGQNDLFGGPAGIGTLGVNAGTATGNIGFAGPQTSPGAWNPAGFPSQMVQAQGFSAKGADAQIQEERVWLYPEIRVNPAIRLRGEYWVTGTNLRGHHPVIEDGGTLVGSLDSIPQGYIGWFISGDSSPGNSVDPTGMSTGLWEKFWATVQLPWGVFAVGRRGVGFGTGWSTAHEKDLDTDGWFLATPYGPLTFLLEGFWADRGTDVFTENAAATLAGIQTAAGSPTVAAGMDKNGKRGELDFAAGFTYKNGPVDMGTLVRVLYHNNAHTSFAGLVPAGPAGADDFNDSAFPVVFLGAGTFLDNGINPIHGDTHYFLWPTYLKYFNGRFFFNAEYAFELAEARRQGGRPISSWADSWEIELGGICGPAKLSLANFYHSGDDRRGGVADFWSAQGGVAGAFTHGANVNDKQNAFLVFGASKEAINPYQYLLGIYGTGNDSYDCRGYGTFQDFLAYAARLDYAVASNLNVWSSFMYANRASNTSTPIGAFRGGVANIGVRAHPGFIPGYVGHYTPIGALGQQIAPIPNVPDNYLGWEWDAGLNWKLLEGFTFNGLFAYWQPGDWFKWAYEDYGSLTTTTVGIGTYPVNPNRAIDPIIGFQGSVVVDF
ncbi:MAG: hypothetical protein ACLP5H_30780 [Desulfomonilaceae bacterium]